MLVWTDVFSALWSYLSDPAVSGEADVAVVPDTVVFQGREVRDWFFSGQGGLQRRQLKAAVNAEVVQSFVERAAGGALVASMVWFTESSGKQPHIRHLSQENLKALLLGTELIELPEGYWILQAFSAPDAGSPMATVICDAGGAKRPSCSQCVCRHKYNPAHPNSLLTIEARDAAHVQVLPRVSERILQLASKVSVAVHEAVAASPRHPERKGKSTHAPPPPLQLFFRPHAGRLVLLFCFTGCTSRGKGKKRAGAAAGAGEAGGGKVSASSAGSATATATAKHTASLNEQRIVFVGLSVQQLHATFAAHEGVSSTEAVVLPAWQGGADVHGLHVRYTGGAPTLRELLDRHWRHVECAGAPPGAGKEASSVPRAVLYCEPEQRTEAESSAFRLTAKFGLRVRSVIAPLPSDMRPLDAAAQAALTIELAAQGRTFRANLVSTQVLGTKGQPPSSTSGSSGGGSSNGGAETRWAQAWSSSTHSAAQARRRHEPTFAEDGEFNDLEEEADDDDDDMASLLALDILSVGGVSARSKASPTSLTPVLSTAPAPQARMPRAPSRSRPSSDGPRTAAGPQAARKTAERSNNIVLRPSTAGTLVQPDWTNPSHMSYAEKFGVRVAMDTAIPAAPRRGRKARSRPSSAHALGSSNHSSGATNSGREAAPDPLHLQSSPQRPASAGSPLRSGWGQEALLPVGSPGTYAAEAGDFPVRRRAPGRMTVMESKVSSLHRPSAPRAGSVSFNANTAHVPPQSAAVSSGRALVEEAPPSPAKASLATSMSAKERRSPTAAAPSPRLQSTKISIQDMSEPKARDGGGEEEEEEEEEEDTFNVDNIGPSIQAPTLQLQEATSAVVSPARRRAPGRMTIMEGKVTGLHRPAAPLPGSVSANDRRAGEADSKRAATAKGGGVKGSKGALPPPAQAEHLLDIVSSCVSAACKSFAADLSGSLGFAAEHLHELQQPSGGGNASGPAEHRQDLAAVVRRLTARSPNNQPETATVAEADVVDTESLSDGAKCFGQLLQLLSACPNHRSPEQLCTILLWLLSSSPSADSPQQAASDKKAVLDVAKGFRKYAALTRQAVAAHTVAQTVRGNYPVPESIAGTKKKGHSSQLTLVQALRCWNAPRLQRVAAAGGALQPPAAAEPELHDAGFPLSYALPMPASPASSPGSPPRAAVSSGSVAAAAGGAAATSLAYKPVAGKPIAPLAQAPLQVSPRANVGASSVAAAAAHNTASSSGRSAYKHVRCHEGMQAFLVAVKWQTPTLVTLAEVAPAEVPRTSVTGVCAQLLDTYEALPAGEEQDGGGDGGSLRHAQHWPAQIVVTGKPRSPSAAAAAVEASEAAAAEAGTLLKLENPDEQEAAAGGHTPPRSPPALTVGASSPSSFPSLPSSPFQIQRGEVVQMKREAAFFSSAPALTAKQRLVMLTALTSDVARTVLVSIFVLARHAWAGKRIRKEDVLAVLGGPCTLALGSKLVEKLCCWLNANCRAVASFKLANESLLEAALLRMYAYWPLLAIQLRSVVDASDESQIKKVLQSGNSGFPDSTCVAALVWPDRMAAEGIFREPHTFTCNANVI